MSRPARRTATPDGTDLAGRPGGFLATGHNVGPHHFLIVGQADGSVRGFSVLLDEGRLEILAETEIEKPIVPVVGAQLGFHLLDDNGTVSSYDRDGELVGELSTAFEWAPEERRGRPGFDPRTGRIAFGAGDGVMVVDPATGTTTIGALSAPVSDVAFSQDGQSLLVGSADGTVRMWDIESGETRATLWRGDTSIEGGSWLDAGTNTLWVVGRGS